MLKIRLQRVGKKHEPVYRVVLTDSQNGPKSGKFLEILGSYDPRDKNESKFREDRIKHWIFVGAKPSDTMHNLLIDKKIIEGEKVNVLPKKSPVVKEEKEEKGEKTEEEPKEETLAEEKSEEKVEEKAEEKPAEEAKDETPVEEPKKEEK